MFGLPNIWKPVAGGAGLIALLLGAWGLRVDHLRAGYKERLETIRIVLRNVGEKVDGYNDIPKAVVRIDLERARYRRERDAAQGVVDVQSSSIRALEQETNAAQASAAANRKLIVEVTRQRDAWIARARSAETRTERLSAEEELKQCNDVLDRLYSQGF